MSHLRKFDQIIARRKKRENLRKHIGARIPSEELQKALMVPAWPLGTPKISDPYHELKTRKTT